MEQDQEQQASKSAPTMYAIHNTSRSRHTRAARAALPQNPRMKQYVGSMQQRLVRGQPLLVSEDMVRANLEELRAKHAAHIIELRTQDGRLVDLRTLEPLPGTPTPPKPRPLLDSVRNDRHQWTYPPGYKFVPQYQSDDITMPNLVKEGEKPALFGQSDLEVAPPADATPTVSADPSVPETEGSEPTAISTDTELEAALASAQSEATEGEDPAPSEDESVQSEERKKSRRSRR